MDIQTLLKKNDIYVRIVSGQSWLCCYSGIDGKDKWTVYKHIPYTRRSRDIEFDNFEEALDFLYEQTKQA